VIWTLEALDHFHFVPTDVDRGVSSARLPEVDDHLLRFVDIEGEIIVAAPDSPPSVGGDREVVSLGWGGLLTKDQANFLRRLSSVAGCTRTRAGCHPLCPGR